MLHCSTNKWPGLQSIQCNNKSAKQDEQIQGIQFNLNLTSMQCRNF